MYRYIYSKGNSDTVSDKLCYHCTKHGNADKIVTQGFKLDPNSGACCLSPSLEHAQDYGTECVACKRDDVLKLKLYNYDENLGFDPKKYAADCQGIIQPWYNGDQSCPIYHIFDIPALNSVVTWIRYPKGDR